MEQPLEIYILPGSGGYFVNQMAMMIAVIRATERVKGPDSYRPPDIVMGTSGGNITAYSTHAGGWTEAGIRRVAGALVPDIFAVPWGNGVFFRVLPSWAYGVFRGSLYNSNKQGGPEAFFQSVFSKHLCTDVEIWTGTVNQTEPPGGGRGMYAPKTMYRTQLYCNRAEKEAQLKSGSAFNDARLASLPPVYLNGDVSALAQVSLASASIPTVVPPVEFRGDLLIDGGDAFSSPMSVLHERVRGKVGSAGGLHMVRFAGYDSENLVFENRRRANIFRTGLNSISHLQCSLDLQDRETAVALVRADNRVLKFQEGTADLKTLSDLLTTRRETCFRSLLELYPSVDNSISIVSFSPENLRQAMNVCLDDHCAKLRYRFWYTAL